MSVKSPLGLVLYCYLNMPTINKTDLILSYLIACYLHSKINAVIQERLKLYEKKQPMKRMPCLREVGP